MLQTPTRANRTVAISNSASPEIIWGFGGPEEDHQLNHCCWTGRVGEREEEKYQFVFKLSYDVQCVFLYYFTRLALDTRSTCHLHHLSQL